jgi:hypothetical protein
MRFLKFVLLGAMALPASYAPAFAGGTFGGSASGAAPPERAARTGTGIFVNGMELTEAQVVEVSELLGMTFLPGRYVVDNSGMMGVEGKPAEFDLCRFVQGRIARGAFD